MLRRTQNKIRYEDDCPCCGARIVRHFPRLRAGVASSFYAGSEAVVFITLDTECHGCGKALRFLVQVPRSQVL